MAEVSTEDKTISEKSILRLMNHCKAEIKKNNDEKVDKVNGKGLSTNDYTTTEKNKLAGLSNYDDTTISGRVSDIEEVVPSNASASNKLATMSDIPSGPSGTTDYDDLTDKPQIAGVTLSGNKSLADLGIQPNEQGKGLSTNDYTDAEKTKLSGLSNYDDTALSGRVSNIEEVIPSTASSSNKLATIEDIPEISEDNTDYNILTEIITKDADQSNIVEVGGVYTLGGGAKNSEDNDIQVKCLSVDNATNTAIMQTYGITTEAQPNNIDLTEHYSSYWGELSSIISNVKLPNNGEHDNTISPNGAKEVLINIKKSCWLARSRCVFDPNGHVYIYDVDKEFICAPYFILDLSKIMINNGIIELSSYKANITDLITKIETKLNNRYTKSEVNTALNNKVDKVNGKGLSTEDYTTAEKTKLSGLSNYDDTALSGRVSDIEEVIPSTVSSSNKLATAADISTLIARLDELIDGSEEEF